MSESRDDLGNPENHDPLYRLRHSLAHVMAQAVLELRPGSLRGFGPPIEDGFYYDFVLSQPLNEEDFPAIEGRMRQIIEGGHPFEHEALPVDRALARLEEMGEPYKAAYARELAARHGLDTIGFFTHGPFVDMCQGPHVETTARLKGCAFKLRSLAGAYWRGDSRNQMMTRVYAWAYDDKTKLHEAIRRHEEGLKRDHKKLGPQLDLFHIDPLIGKGLPLWLPHGTVLRDELERLAKEKEFLAGYQRVATPQITRQELYYQSGHLPYYQHGMFPPMVVGESHGDGDEVYLLRPMNCPHHHRVFASRLRSYRELPLRLAEYGQVFRFEQHGSLSGLLRVRGMCMNDAHIYCSEDQVESEFLAVMSMYQEYFALFGITDYYIRLSLWDPHDEKGREKYVDDPQAWALTEDKVRRALQASGLAFVEARGEAAFYGPKVDIQLRTVTGREETFSTNQLDFAVPRADRMNLRYVGPDGREHHPFVIHRAPLGTHERFIAYLIEHFGGAFPTWLAPIQVRILPVGEKFVPYAVKLLAALRQRFVRAEVDDTPDKVGKKVRTALSQKIPMVLVVGQKEETDGTVTLRRYGEEAQETLPFDVYLARLSEEITNRTMRRKPGV